MDFKQIDEWVHNPESLTAEDVSALDDLCTKYPWSAPLQVLRAKAHKNANRFTFKSHLHKAALLVGDREVLYHIMQGAKKEETKAVVIESPKVVEPNEPVETIPTDSKNQVKEESVPEIAETEQAIESVESAEPEVVKDLKDSIEEVDVQEEQPKDYLEELLSEAPAYDPEKELMKLVEKEKQEATEEEDKELDFTSWLDELEDEPEKVIEEKRPAVSMDKDAHELLAQFLEKRNKARVERVERKPVQLEPKVEEEDMVTESLAGLYVKQGHYKEAIKAYEKLSLQNPSKNAYFAALIEEIKNKQKET